MKKPVKFLLIALVITAALLLSACGSSGEPARSATTDGGDGGDFASAADAMESSEMTRKSFGLAPSPLAQGIASVESAFSNDSPAPPPAPAASAPAGASGAAGPAGTAGPVGAPGPAGPAQPPSQPGLPGLAGQSGPAAERKIIFIASLSIEVEQVEAAVDRARAVAESLGGFVEHLSSSGGSETPRADLTIRIPQTGFSDALERIESLGEVQFRNLGSEDVTEQFIDLGARLKSSMAEEKSLLALLERSNSVTEILTVERELTRVRADIERAQGRLNFLERRVDLATIQVSLFLPGSGPSNPPVANFTIDASDVSDQVNRLKSYVAGLGGAMDQVYLYTNEGGERAEVTFRVFSQDFYQASAFIEDQGKLRSRNIREGILILTGEETPRAKRPDARIDVVYLDESFDFQPWMAIFGIVLALALAGAMAVLLRVAYRRGRRRGSFI